MGDTLPLLCSFRISYTVTSGNTASPYRSVNFNSLYLPSRALVKLSIEGVALESSMTALLYAQRNLAMSLA